MELPREKRKQDAPVNAHDSNAERSPFSPANRDVPWQTVKLPRKKGSSRSIIDELYSMPASVVSAAPAAQQGFETSLPLCMPVNFTNGNDSQVTHQNGSMGVDFLNRYNTNQQTIQSQLAAFQASKQQQDPLMLSNWNTQSFPSRNETSLSLNTLYQGAGSNLTASQNLGGVNNACNGMSSTSQPFVGIQTCFLNQSVGNVGSFKQAWPQNDPMWSSSNQCSLPMFSAASLNMNMNVNHGGLWHAPMNVGSGIRFNDSQTQPRQVCQQESFHVPSTYSEICSSKPVGAVQPVNSAFSAFTKVNKVNKQNGHQAVERGSKKSKPILKLTKQLLPTYKGINSRYFVRQSKILGRKRIYNEGFDDESGDYIVRAGDIINERYQISVKQGSKSPILGKGSFGQVVYAFDLIENLGVALKIIKNQKHFHEQAKTEIELLKKFLRVPVPDSIPISESIYKGGRYLPCTQWVEYANVVRMLDTFIFRNHQCLVFELLPMSLYDLLKLSKFKGFPLTFVRKFARNILQNLEALRAPEVDVIHCDLKPENVMLIKANEHRIKVIDFGSSCSSGYRPFTYIQSRFYRSPEVLLCRSYSYAIDMWSLGCIMVEMHTGSPLFNGKNEYEQMQKICEMFGLPPDHMLQQAGSKSKVKNMFRKGSNGGWRMCWPGDREIAAKSRIMREVIRKPNSTETEQTYLLLEDLLEKILTLDPEVRCTPTEALCHPFFTSIP